MMSSVVRPRRSFKALPKPKLAPKKGHGHCLVVHFPSDPLQLSESWQNHSKKYAQHIDEMQLKLQGLLPALVNRKSSVLLHDNAWLHVTQPMLQNLNKLGCKVLPYLEYSPDFLPTNYHFFKHLSNFLQPAGCRKCFPRVCWTLRHRFLATGINKLISYWQKYLDCNGSYFD